MKKEHSFRLACISTPPLWIVLGDVLIDTLLVGGFLVIVIKLLSKKTTLRKAKVKVALVVLGGLSLGLALTFLFSFGSVRIDSGYSSLIWRAIDDYRQDNLPSHTPDGKKIIRVKPAC